MSEQIHTDRLVLRPFREDDREPLATAFNDERVWATVPTMPHPYTSDHARADIARALAGAEADDYIAWAIVLMETGRLIGRVSLTVDLAHDSAELSYALGAAHWGNGFATEASRAAVRYAFGDLRLHRVWAGHLVGNETSARVLFKLGLTKEGVARGAFKRDGEYLDDVVYSVLATDGAE